MILSTKPRIIISNERKLHVSRKPKFITLSFLSLTVIIFIKIFWPTTNNYLYRIILFLGEIIFCLDTVGECQDLLLDRDKDIAVIKKYTWLDKLCLKTGCNFCTVFKLSNIRYVGISIEMGLFILCKDGKTISVNMQGFTRKELQELRKEINFFLSEK
ncbi:uncharacterized protein LOC116428161 [Nomia melanderi]|uniref:uncharacterized protein LOC116428161 n=1 Tax=Nomia melanderi TaxID=2448451 RepID=UPI00130414B8|nr:uncharacterized protein LOC116428161 [Nomia melanderi]XP_031835291.1 uncharacterized protein LOC116428161 [Nomia melanderi]XP_031835292.1 uncharacterized protein LOC116428161 [Nomia melanderi]XP_031835293.1 uncharacterized protein LOC116428161 [Nomia melanderi]